MTPLKYTLKMDTLFKMLFAKYQDLLKRLVADLLDIKYEDITHFKITNPEISPEELGKKFCRLDINMEINDQKVDLEVQVADEGNYPERSLYYWAREFSTGINEGEDYRALPRTIIISILGYNQFPDTARYHREFQCLEVTTHEALTDKQSLHFYELKKLPPLKPTDNTKDLWLKLFNAETEEDLAKIEALEVPIMSEAIGAYRNVAASDELKRIERAMSKARHDEAQALGHARREERKHWQGVAAENEELKAQLAELKARLGEQ
ncbi:MAG: Rpn family recombination-promoting nuclease/putative transposase [Oscillospiraceae bacterium]|nr:Rpn family recombination-promoting nuclease/putative transposase [Oscillospiraceae bacterium]